MPSLYRENLNETNNQTGVLKRIVFLRAAVILCLIPALLVVHFVLSKPLDLVSLSKVITAALIVSTASYFWHRYFRNPTERSVFIQLVIDALITACIVYFSGRSANPFIYYWLVLVAIAATIFPSRTSVVYTSLTIALYSTLLYLDVHEHLHHASEDFQLHLIGMWINFVGSALLVTFFISRLASALKDQQILLAKAREDTLKNEQLIGIGTLAASTVHALGTPLSTLTLLTEELQEDLNQAGQNHSDIASTMQSQILRCKQTLGKLTALAEKQNQHPQPMRIKDFITEIIDHYSVVGAKPAPEFALPDAVSQHKILHNLLLNHALINLIDNAIHAAREKVLITLSIRDSLCVISIEDDGQGLPEQALKQWGKMQQSQKSEGLGIGVFLANSTIEKLGGAILLNNKTANANTSMKIKLPLWDEN